MATDFEKTWGIPAERVGLARPTNRDLAAEVRAGGGMLVKWPHARKWDPETLRLAAKVVTQGRDRDRRLPPEAWDWPIYRAALTQTTEDCQSRGHREYGPPITCRDHPNGCGNVLSESESRLLDGNR